MSITGQVIDTDGTVVSVEASATDTLGNQTQLSTQSIQNGQFTLTSGVLADELYLVSVVATDNEGAQSEPATTSVRIGPPPPDTAPVLSNVTVTVEGQTATVTGNVVDVNQNLTSVTVVGGKHNGSGQH